ncbi:hypothetical protein DDB_G0267206 [Dictyostelium discoideum AX4]|uniref:Reverse transcriptase domain-containing protein n=1 Tax=Dictyostelium discoideum TaxID=44689 RepID=Q55H44_DICDI|nr:hypothetical protein DDB_G0267206 [Dictyostelium discoideum AX4]EAL73840.1 hypothetical protein DDB_G0267206 [Dictyostelium discoideum AX4]|eukprot:XP_647764.1 hypothetical protein DDB_G0267206 [Dictyostelium discoideum AX4]
MGGRLFHHKQVWKKLGLPNFCQEVLNGLKVHLLPNFKPMLNPIPISIPEGPKSDCITKETYSASCGKVRTTVGKQCRSGYRQLLVSLQCCYLDDLLIVGSTNEKCLANLKKTMDLLVKLGFKFKLEKSVLEPTQSITFLGLRIDSISKKLLVPKEKKKSVIKEIRNFLKLDCCSPRKLAGLKGKLMALKDAVIPFRLYTRRTNNLFPSYDYVLTVVNNSIKHVIKSSRNARAVNGLSIAMSETEQLQAEDSNRQHYHSFLHQSPGWSDTRSLSSVRTTLETMPQEESELDWRAYSRILQCKSRPPRPSFRNESQIIVHSNQELQLATEEGSVQSYPTSIRSNTDGSVRISPQPSNDQLLNHQNECTQPRLESMEAMSSLPTTHSFAFYRGEDKLIQFEEGFYNTDLPNLEISNLVSDDSSTSSSSSSSHVSSSTGNIPRSIDQTISRVDTNSDSTTLEVKDYSTFQYHVMSFARTTNTKTAEVLGTFHSQTNITLVVFLDYLTHLFKHKPPLAFSTINGHRSMLNQLLLLRNQTDIVNDPFITRIMTALIYHQSHPPSTHTLIYYQGLIITTESIKGPVINAKEQRSGVVSILELTSLDDKNSQVCPNESEPLQVNDINSIVLSTLSKSGIDIVKFKSHSTRSAMASLLLSNNVPFHVVKKMGRWKSNDTVDTF